MQGQEKTLGQTYDEIYQQTGKRAPQLDGPELPAAGERVMSWFWDLSEGRSQGFSALQTLSWGEMRAYFLMIRARPAPWQIRLIRRLDQIYVTMTAQEAQLGTAITGTSGLRASIE